MLRTLARRGASALVAAALVGGALALSGGTASAANTSDPVRVPLSGYDGSVANQAAHSVLIAGVWGGSVDPWYISEYCSGWCSGTRYPNYVEYLIGALQGRDKGDLRPLYLATPDDDLPRGFGSFDTPR